MPRKPTSQPADLPFIPVELLEQFGNRRGQVLDEGLQRPQNAWGQRYSDCGH